MDKQKYNNYPLAISQILGLIEANDIAIPEIQRPFVWRKSQGYLKITTVHPGEGIIGYMNIKRERGQMMTVNIPVGDGVYSFEWDVTKKK